VALLVSRLSVCLYLTPLPPSHLLLHHHSSHSLIRQSWSTVPLSTTPVSSRSIAPYGSPPDIYIIFTLFDTSRP
jgi:hypothetical protein